MELKLLQGILFCLLLETSRTAPADLFTFNNGNVGVDFLGLRASAGLGGILTGNAADGGLHAEAGTPFGQTARAGLLGSVHNGRSVGGLYADATAGGGVEAGAGLAGHLDAEGSAGNTYAGASAGGASAVVKEKTIVNQPVVSGSLAAQTSISQPAAEVEVHKEVVRKPTFGLRYHKEVVVPGSSAGAIYTAGSSAGLSAGGAIEVHKEVVSKPAVAVTVHKEVVVPEVEKHVKIIEEIKPQKTYIERTVIPNYEEKTIYVPSYVEKTIRVPTVVEKKVKVPVAPTVIEKTVGGASSSVDINAGVNAEVVPTQTIVYQKTKFHTRPHFRKHFHYAGGYEASSEAGTEGGVAASGGVTFRKNVNAAHLIDNIFNIPIATLGAVNKLVGGLAGGADGSLQFSKSASFSKY